jgi:phage regulator Rha-like protein
MSNLVVKVIKHSNQPRVDSRLISEGLNIDHPNLIELIYKYQEKIERFGIIPFETEKKNKRGRPTKFCYLNESQSNFVVSLAKNTDQVVDFKFALVEAFEKAKKLLAGVKQIKPSPIQQRWLVNAGQVPIGYFSMIHEAVNIFALPLEKKFGYILPEKLLIEISMGLGFCNLLRSRNINPSEVCLKYNHTLPNGNTVKANAYPMQYYSLFFKWFTEDWIKKKAQTYFKNKDPLALQHLPKLLH